MNKSILLIIFGSLIFLRCAKEGFPPGGPEDRQSPILLSTFPKSGATRVPLQENVLALFDERLQPASVQNNIFISPFPGKDVNILVRGHRVKILFPGPLKPDRTYVITFGTGIKDYRNNAMENSYSLAFSTGDTLDRCEIKGKVYGLENPQGIDVWAYQFPKGKDPDPLRVEPDYIVQCSEDGSFHFSNISCGAYRMMAVRDRYGDRLYQKGEDEFGVSFKDILLTKEQSVLNQKLSIRMTREDTLGPALVRSMVGHQNHFLLKLDENVILSSRFDAVTVVSSQNSLDTLKIWRSYIDPVDRKTVHFITGIQHSSELYRGRIQGITDYSGNPPDSLNRWFEFQGSSQPDTTKPELIRTFPESNGKNVPLNSQIHLIFNEALDPDRFFEGFALSDTHDVRIPGSFKWKNPAEIIFIPDSMFNDETLYRIHLKVGSISDLSGNSLADTLFQFQTLNEDTLSEIEGFVFDPDTNASGPISVKVYQTADTSKSYTVTLKEPGEFQFLKILPGLYKLETFRDRDSNGRYDYGRPFPFLPSERFTVYQDTIKARSRWPNAGNDIHLP